MPRIFDNIELKLLPILQETLKTAKRADFCVGYFNLRGWQGLDRQVEQFPGRDQGCCRLIVGMQKSPSLTKSSSPSKTKPDSPKSCSSFVLETLPTAPTTPAKC